MKRNTRERRVAPHSHLGLTGGTLYNDPTEALGRRVAEAQSAGEDRAHSKTREIKMQVSPPPPTGGAGQHHQVEPGEESTLCEHTAHCSQYHASLVPFKPCFLKV